MNLALIKSLTEETAIATLQNYIQRIQSSLKIGAAKASTMRSDATLVNSQQQR